MKITRKFVCLFMLLSGARVNTISHLKMINMCLTYSECTFALDDTLKHSYPFYKEKSLNIKIFPQNPKLCPVTALTQYLDIGLLCSSETALFIT